MSGLPSRTAREMAAAVEALSTTQPASIGSPPEGTRRPVSTWMSCFSLPCGYLARTAHTRASVPAAFCRLAAASGLLSSTPMSSSFAPTILRGKAQAVHDGVRLLHHHAVVGAQKGLALRAVEDDGVDGLVLGRGELDVRGERRPAHADHARLAHGLQELFRGGVAADGGDGGIPFVQAVVFQNDRGHAAAAGDDARLDALDPARDRRVHRSADKAIRRADLLPHIHALADLDHGLAGRAGVLQKRHRRHRRRGQRLNGQRPRGRFSPAPSRGCTPRRNVNVLPNALSPIFRAQGAIWIFIYPYPAKFASKSR